MMKMEAGQPLPKYKKAACNCQRERGLYEDAANTMEISDEKCK